MTFWDSYKYKNIDKITQILENVVRSKYFEAGAHIKNPIKNPYQDGLNRTTQTLDHVVVVHIPIWGKRKSQINEYSDLNNIQQNSSSHASGRRGKWPKAERSFLACIFVFSYSYHSTLAMGMEDLKQMQLTHQKNIKIIIIIEKKTKKNKGQLNNCC